jgi:hypothetical protein
VKKQIFFPDRRWAICLNYRITMLNMKCISIYALIVKSTSLQVMCIKNLPCGVVSRKGIVRNRQLHVMCVRKFSSVRVPGSYMCAVTQGRSRLHVIYVRKVLNGPVISRSICALMLGRGHINVMYVRNFSSSLVL